MAPKKKVPVAVVTQAELDSARKDLADAEQRKRAMSQMRHWLKNQNCKDDYDNMIMAQKKIHFENYWANELKLGGGTKTTRRALTTQTGTANLFEWMSNQRMIDKFGATKAQAEIESNALETQPDPDTNLDDEWNREYKIWHKTGGTRELDTNTKEIETEKQLKNGQEAEEAVKDFNEKAACMAGNIDTEVKEETDGEPVTPAEKEQIEKQKRIEDLTASITSDSKKVLKNVAEQILKMKKVWVASKEGKYLKELHTDTTAVLPKLAKVNDKLEKIHIEKIDDATHIRAVAVKLEEVWGQTEELLDWHGKLTTSPAPKKAKKAEKTSS